MFQKIIRLVCFLAMQRRLRPLPSSKWFDVAKLLHHRQQEHRVKDHPAHKSGYWDRWLRCKNYCNAICFPNCAKLPVTSSNPKIYEYVTICMTFYQLILTDKSSRRDGLKENSKTHYMNSRKELQLQATVRLVRLQICDWKLIEK